MAARFASFVAVLLLAAPAASAHAADVSTGECADTTAQQSPLRPIQQIFEAKSPSALIQDVVSPYLTVGATQKMDSATVDHVLAMASHEHPMSARLRVTMIWVANVMPSRLANEADERRIVAAANEGLDFQSLSRADKLELAQESLVIGRGSVIGVSRTEKSIQGGDVSKMKLPHPLGLLVTDRIESIRKDGMKKGDLAQRARPTSITVERWSRDDQSWAWRISLSFDAKRGSNTEGMDGWDVTQLLDGHGRPLQSPQWSESGNDGN